MNVPLPFSTAQAARFLQLLAGNDLVTFQTFSDRDDLKVTKPDGKQFDPNAMWRHSTLKELETHLKRMNTKGAGIYVMVNEGNGKGRSTNNVLRVRVLFIDTDGAPFPSNLPLKPHLIVGSSPGKWHLYWLVNGLELADFATMQKALAKHYGTDPSVHDLPRVMRLPGFYHCKAEPVMVQLLEAHDHAPFTPADIFTAWPFLTERLEQEKTLAAEKELHCADLLKLAAERRATSPYGADRNRRRALTILAAHHDRVASAGDGTRHRTLKESAYTLGGYVGSGYLEAHKVEDVLRAAAEVCGLPDGEAAHVICWGLEKGAEKPLELTADKPRMFGAELSFGAKEPAPNIARLSHAKPCLGHLNIYRTIFGGKPSLGGKRCH